MTTVAPSPPPPVQGGGFCGRCGAPFGPGSGGFCGRCGATIAAAPVAAQGYAYPVLPPSAVPATHLKVASHRLWLVVGAALAVLVVVITSVAVLSRPQPGTACGISCPPPGGPGLKAPHTYTSSSFGWSADYRDDLTPQASDDKSISWTVGDCPFEITTVDGGDPGQIIQSALSAKYPSAQFGTPTKQFDLRGAQIGFQPGQGQILDANFSPQQGGSTEVRIVVETASKDGVTVVADGFCAYDPKDSGLYGLASGDAFSYPLTEFRWKGQY